MLVESPLTIRCPDIVVGSEALLERDPARLMAADVLLVVEVVSQGTARMDRVMKMSEYGDAGIPAYWIVEPEPLRLQAYELTGGIYREVATADGPVDLVVAGRPVRLDVSTLIDR